MKPLAPKPLRRRKSTQTIEQRNSRLTRMSNTQWGKGDEEPKAPTELGHFTTQSYNDMGVAHGTPIPKSEQITASQVAKDIKARDLARERGELDDEPEPQWGVNRPEQKHYIDYLVANGIDWIVGWDGYKIFHPALKLDDEFVGEDEAGLNSIIEANMELVTDEEVVNSTPETVQGSKDAMSQILEGLNSIGDRLTKLENGSTIKYISANDPGKITGASHDVIYLDESADIPPEAIEPQDYKTHFCVNDGCSNVVAMPLDSCDSCIEIVKAESDDSAEFVEAAEKVAKVLANDIISGADQTMPAQELDNNGRWTVGITKAINQSKLDVYDVIAMHEKLGRCVTVLDMK